MNKEDLKELLKDATEKGNLVNGIGSMNIFKRSLDEQVDIDLKYEIAQIEYRKADEKYKKALAIFCEYNN